MNKQDQNIESIYPLSPMQLGMLFHTLSAPNSGVYFNQILHTLTGPLQEDQFRLAWQQVLPRHEPLRTLFVWEGQEKPLQVVRRHVSLPWRQFDWRAFPPAEQSARLASFLQADRQQGFNFAEAPLMRLALIRLEDNRYELVWSNHHVVIDGWSTFILFKEVMSFYRALTSGRDCSLEPARPYRDYIKWLQQQDPAKTEQFWRATLHGFAAPTPLLGDVADKGRSPQASQTVDLRGHSPATLVAALKSFGKQHDLTLGTLVHAAWALLLNRYSGEDDVVFGSTVSGRPAELPGVGSMVGLFINTLPVRARFSPRDSVLDWLKNFQSQLVLLRQFEQSPLVDVQGWSDVPRDKPLFESCLVFENYPIDTSMPGQNETLRFSNLRVFGPTNFPLTFVVAQGTEFSIRVSYNDRRFDSAAMTRLLGHFNSLLQGIVANPHRPLSDLPLLSEAERRQILLDWNRTDAPYPKDRCLHQLIEEQVERTPDAVAVVFEDNQLTYRQLDERANQLACRLQKLGVGPDALVGICMERSLEMVVGLLGILKAGGAYVPLDPAYPKERLAFMLEDAAVKVLLTQARLAGSLPGAAGRLLCLDADWPAVAAESAAPVESGVGAQHLAYMIYTSGSTGRPKGAMNTHRGIVNRLLWMQDAYHLTPRDRVLQKTPFSFDVSAWEFFWPLLTGAGLVLARPGGHKDGAYLAQLIARNQITTLHFVPSMLQAFLEQKGLQASCSSLQRVICSGEALPLELQRRFFSVLEAQLHNLYGPTEASVDVTYWACQRESRLSTVPIGRPIANTQIYILDPKLQPVPIGVPGELHIGGIGLARGYHNRPELTAQKFIPDPFRSEPEARLYKSGDLARYLPDGNIEYLGRLDHQVKIRGFRIELGEIESLLDQHPQVRASVVLAREDSPGDKRLVGYIVSQNGAANPSELREFLRAKLPDYMVPAAFVFLEKFPLTPNGKIDRKALPKPDFEPAAANFVPPGTPTEIALAEIWCKVLRLKQVGVHDNFFSLGGDSILSIQIVSKAHQAGLRLTAAQVFNHQTIAELALVAEPARSAAPKQTMVSEAPLTPIQQRFFEEDFAEPHYWNQTKLWRLPTELDHDVLERAMRRLIHHHDALRLRFRHGDDGWTQVHDGNEAAWSLNRVNLTGLAEEQQRVAMEKVAGELQAQMDLTKGPLFKAAWFDLGSRQTWLFLAVHHLVVDGVSWRILQEDLEDLLQQAMRGQEMTLPAKSSSFLLWATRLAEHARSADLRREADYWLAPASNLAPLPVDFSEGANTEGSARSVQVALGPRQTQLLLQDVPRAYNTEINDVLLSALALALSRWLGTSVVQIELEGHGREDLFPAMDVSRTVGWFTTMFPLTLDLRATNGPAQVLKAIKEQLRRVPNRGIGYGLLRYLSGDQAVAAKLRSRPRPGILFNYLGQFDQSNAGGRSLESLPVRLGPSRSLRAGRSHLLEVNSQVINGALQMDWTYSQNRHRLSAVQSLAEDFIKSLRVLIAHCTSPAAGGYTPSDFSQALLSQEELDGLLSELDNPKANL